MAAPHGLPDFDDTTVRKRLCGLAVELCGSQVAFKREAAILKRLVKKFGAQEVEHMLRGAKYLGWNTLRSLGSAEGLGRRWAVEAYWQREKRRDWKPPEALREIFAKWGQG